MMLEQLGRRALFTLDPERAHTLSIAALKSGLPLACAPDRDLALTTNVAGIEFANPIGMAAGYDKNAEVADPLLRLGFGFAEVGTLTPRAQPGNPKPRIFRLEEDEAVINRLGFNNEGHAPALARLQARAGKGGVVGINIGANKDSDDRINDYRLGVERFASLATYLTVNISSPNTPGLRDLQARSSLAELLAAVENARDEQTALIGRHVPVFLKIAPDLVEDELDDIAAEVLDKRIEGVIVSNTTLSRDGLTNRKASETGGMSGKPLFARSTVQLARMRRRLGPDVALIGCGGVDSAETAAEKIRAGADLVQLYTGMIYGGPSLPARIVRDLGRLLRREGYTSITQMRDTGLERWEAASF
ncbi:quinone-dependent dihydroorotate dehydrogenase [Aquamicrobium zhengzhouense]|uniref:Dihydroorotate dehydrogenase (quinone) n=1 Tax=Aquamicrobium zhengzhouense TaxID=2781738 RepID=A0ABS0SCP6_9HYPH|nr:quinone-dependent dihydroorotate dehydrogenase [Aquamicrobium zhengzhouense]MBI1621037.1 quinone-dependent dihydroorotate dehydrogenase [Aquamicrobium zhengzhouense]